MISNLNVQWVELIYFNALIASLLRRQGNKVLQRMFRNDLFGLIVRLLYGTLRAVFTDNSDRLALGLTRFLLNKRAQGFWISNFTFNNLGGISCKACVSINLNWNMLEILVNLRIRFKVWLRHSKFERPKLLEPENYERVLMSKKLEKYLKRVFQEKQNYCLSKWVV